MSYIVALCLPETTPGWSRMKALYSTRLVSRMWKNAIESTPSLWNVVSSALPLQVNSTAIQRSSCSPLDVYITKRGVRSNQRQTSELLALATREIRRWSTAVLWFPSPDVCSFHLASPAPQLRALRVTSGSWNRSSRPITLFGGIAPKLETLEVDRLPVDWTSPFICGLRVLDIFSLRQEELSAQQVLDLLASAPLLERLGIHNSTLDHHFQSSHIPLTILQLPNLKIIIFQGINTEATVVILSSIRAPNCTALGIIDWWGEEIGVPSFPEPALSHFNDFLRLTLSANSISTIHFSDNRMGWESRSTSRLEFELDIPYDALAIGVRWVTNVLGLGTQELVHNMEVVFDHERLDDDDLATYYSFSSCQSVTELKLHSDHMFTRPILELLGTWRESDGGTGRLPAFSSLEILVLEASSGWTLDDLEVLVSRRFGERDDGIGRYIPNLSIVLRAWPYPDYGPGSKAQLQRLRRAKGVNRLIRIYGGDTLGMLAVVYEDDTEL
ncbi:hypothetical protein FRC00_007426 [Tulasnella sp. 408]|nr:hypothetical protein FRC00_007426 [Tulasnella sp. 408]